MNKLINFLKRPKWDSGFSGEKHTHSGVPRINTAGLSRPNKTKMLWGRGWGQGFNRRQSSFTFREKQGIQDT